MDAPKKRYLQSAKGKATMKRIRQRWLSSPKGKAWQSRYNKSAKRKAWKRQYDKSEKVLAWRKQYTQTEAFRESQKRYRQSAKGKQSRRAKEKRYRQSPVYKAHHKKHKAIRRGNAKKASLTAVEWKQILESYNYRCAYCGCSPACLEQDHYIPLCKGGTHTKENVVPACRSCNARKHMKHPHRLF